MFYNCLDDLIGWLHTLPFWAVSTGLVLVCFISILVLLRLYSKSGLYAYIIVAVVVSNIQVLKMSHSSFFTQPITLGSMVFTTSFLATVILTEYFGKQAAHKGILLGFAGYFLMSLFMVITLGFKPIDVQPGYEEFAWASENHHHLYCIFSPAPRLFLAGVIAYFFGQFCNVGVFSAIRRVLKGDKWLWLGNLSAMISSALVDDLTYSFFAWYFLPEKALPVSIIIYSMVIPSFLIRLTVNTVSTPVVYLAKYFLPKVQKVQQ